MNTLGRGVGKYDTATRAGPLKIDRRIPFYCPAGLPLGILSACGVEPAGAASRTAFETVREPADSSLPLCRPPAAGSGVSCPACESTITRMHKMELAAIG